MASIYLRRLTWWIQFYHPLDGRLVRESLGTSDPARADLLRRRVELEAELQHPRFRAVDLPANVLEALEVPSVGARPATIVAASAAPVVAVKSPSEPEPSPPAPKERTRIDNALKAYLGFIKAENSPHHVAGKLSMMRKFFGTERIAPIALEMIGPPKRALKVPVQPGFFAGEFVDEIRSSEVLRFLDQLDAVKKTKRHYREFFHHFFEFCLNFGIFRSDNSYCPNPIAALPSFVSKNRRIVFLSPEQVEEQLAVLAPYPRLRIAVALMIFAGLRRAETLWMTKDAISADGTFLSVVNRVDEERDIESSLKTGDRSVTILPPLRDALRPYCDQPSGKWLVPSSKGQQWAGNEFSKALRRINKASGLKWTCLHYRHTYATQRAADGWSLFRIAKEMGNSVSIVEEYYAA